MPPKPKTPQPIDRPLSRAYLREFTGWSTAFSPGLSDPTTLRIMENCWLTREGALAVRPALRSVFPAGDWLTTNFNTKGLIGSVESFFLNDGTKALLFAVREQSDEITFKVARYNSGTNKYDVIELPDAGFTGSTSAMSFTADTRYVRYLQIDNKILALPDSPNELDTVRIFFVGEDKMLVAPQELSVPEWDGSDAPFVRHPDAAWINGNQSPLPSPETPTAGSSGQPLTGTLIDSDAADNVFNFGYFYTFYNDLGETNASQMAVVKTKRPWSQWQWQTPDGSGNPSGTNTTDPTLVCDQLVVAVLDAVRQVAEAEGATGINFYMVTWSDQGAIPTDAQMIGTIDWREVDPLSDRGRFIQHTPVAEFSDVLRQLPSEGETNYTRPSSAAQGAVAGDRVILVNDRQNPARIIWSSNQIGEYTNFSATRGGGFKTLTAGNLLVPAAVKLWQNPQSVDTLVVMCMGVDGYSTSYYMAPAEVTGLDSSTLIMGFEETTATPGTVSPWGTEVVDQALYHPLDEQLMKSTAANYRISHNTQTDPINNKWLELINKRNIVSSHLDGRIYYIVHNPDGEELEDGCMGNEIWVMDTELESAWSRWLVQANSLHTLEIGGKIHMAITRPDAIFIFDTRETLDEFSDSGETSFRAIPWKIETNTQGANRAHDAWCRLAQANITLGNFIGSMRYGIRGWDRNGRRIDESKIVKSNVELLEDDPAGVDLRARPLPWDMEDYLEINRDLKEWVFYAESLPTYSGLSINLAENSNFSHSPDGVRPGRQSDRDDPLGSAGSSSLAQADSIPGTVGYSLEITPGIGSSPSSYAYMDVDNGGQISPILQEGREYRISIYVTLLEEMAAGTRTQLLVNYGSGTIESAGPNTVGTHRLELTTPPIAAGPRWIRTGVDSIEPTDLSYWDRILIEDVTGGAQSDGTYVEPLTYSGDTLRSYGQINLVQYRYSPISVNVGYGFGSVETFQYGRASAPTDPTTHYPNGVPTPFIEPGEV